MGTPDVALFARALRKISLYLVGLSSLWTGVAFAQTPETTRQQQAGALDVPLSAPRPIEAGQSFWLEELTWMEIRDLIAAGTTTAIIPTGGIEQNGPYLATGKHNYILDVTCPAIAQELGNALCAPVVKFVPEGSIDPPKGHMLYSGTISARDETFRALVRDIADSLKQHGFKDIVLIGDSGGNQGGLQAAAESLNEAWAGSGAVAHHIREYYDPGWSETKRYTVEELGVSEPINEGLHDDFQVTAIMAAADPESVRYRQRVDAGLASINGVEIEPIERTIGLGEKMVAFRAQYTATAVRKAIGDADRGSR